MTDRLIVFLNIIIWLVLAFLAYLKYKKTVKDLKKTQEALEESKKVLEVQVKARTSQLREQAESLREENERKTKDLKARLSELERFHRLSVGREMKMVELKRKIRKMEVQLRETDLAIKRYAGKSNGSKAKQNKKSNRKS